LTIDSRDKMVRSAASLISSRGASATSFSDVLSDSGAPRGSIYHHFPDGKRQLVEDAISWTSERVLAHQRTCQATTARGVLDHFVAMWRYVVVSSNGTAGCAVAGVAIDSYGIDAALIGSVRAIFRAWAALLAEQLEAVGVPPSRAKSFATTSLAAMEGALILCRSEGDAAPLEVVAADLRSLLAHDSS
jgi:TetR/AcrR family transcriptional regulator, lmrAB and yxaGH operons repressor